MNFQGSSNIGHQLSSNLGGYLMHNNHLDSSNQNVQNSTYPLFHPAAMAAVAAAAAGYSQQFNQGNISRPLNLTANPTYPNSYNFHVDDDTNKASYYTNFALQQSGMYPPSNVGNSYMHLKSPHDFSLPNLCTTESTMNGINNIFNYGQCVSKHNSAFTSTSNSSKCTLASKTVKQGTNSGGRTKKSANAEEMANRKRQEFNELIKARTEKLMSDGPVYTSVSNSGPLSSSSSTGSTVPEPSGPNYRKLIHAVMDAKKSSLLRSPAIINFLDQKQYGVSKFKRQTELFSVSMIRR